MNRKGELAFRAVAIISSVLLLVASLLLCVRTAARNDAAARMRREAEMLRQENARLLADCELDCGLAELERYASEQLGMQRLSGEQIIRVVDPVG